MLPWPWPCASLGSAFISRPSSHTAASEPSFAANIETNPCSALTSSRCGMKGLSHVFPPSNDREIVTSYPLVPCPLLTSQWAASELSGSATIEGKSAQLTNQFDPSAMTRGVDQPPFSSVANRSETRPSPNRSIQLK